MRPLTLSMEGFGAFHERVDIDVSDVDLLALVGPTGSGKSTIIDAITFALYGSVARYDDNRAVEPVINQTSTQARVQLDFELGRERYRATRVVRRTKRGATTPEARLERGAEVLADDARGMTARVGELLGLDVEQFNKTVVLPQGRFAEFLHDKPADRQTTMRRLLDLGLYERMGKAARQRGNTARAQADGFGEDVAELAAALSDERRAELVAATTALSDAQRVVAAALADVERADAELVALEVRRRDDDTALTALEAVVAPVGLNQLDDDHRAAAADVAAAADRLDAARDARRRAQDAAAAGPDLLTAQRQQDAHGRLRDQQAAHDGAVEAAAEARRRVEASAAAAATLTAQLDALAGAARAAAAAERVAADAVGEGPDDVAVGRMLDQHERLAQAEAGLAPLGDAVTTAERRAEAAEGAAVRAAADADDERRRLDDARLRAGAAGLVAALRVGDDCPVCQQTVRSLPTAHGPAELAERQDALDRAVAAATAARTAAAAARRQADTAGAEALALHRAADELRLALAGAPPFAQLLAARDESARLRALAAAGRTEAARAETALEAARADPATVAVLTRAAEDERARQERTAAVAEHVRLLAAARAAVTGLPSPAAVAAAIDDAVALGKARDRAEEEFGRAEADHGDAVRRRDTVAARAVAARDALGTARDSVAALAPPVLDRTDVVAAWAELCSWAEATAVAITARHDADRARGAAVMAEREAALGAARRAVAAVLPAAGDARDLARPPRAGPRRDGGGDRHLRRRTFSARRAAGPGRRPARGGRRRRPPRPPACRRPASRRGSWRPPWSSCATPPPAACWHCPVAGTRWSWRTASSSSATTTTPTRCDRCARCRAVRRSSPRSPSRSPWPRPQPTWRRPARRRSSRSSSTRASAPSIPRRSTPSPPPSRSSAPAAAWSRSSPTSASWPTACRCVSRFAAA